MAKIQVSKGLLAGMAGTALAAVLGLAFVLGRASVRGGPEVAPAPAQAPAALGAPTLAPAGPAPAPAQASGPVRETAQAQPPPAAPAPAPRPQPSTAAPADALRGAVAAYFRAVEQIQPQQSGSPDAVAQQLVAGFAKGDTAGFDDLLRQAQATRDRMAALTPPSPCADYHRESLATLDGGLELMRGIRQAVSGAAGTQTLDLAAAANALKARSEALQEQEKALKQRYL